MSLSNNLKQGQNFNRGTTRQIACRPKPVFYFKKERELNPKQVGSLNGEQAGPAGQSLRTPRSRRVLSLSSAYPSEDLVAGAPCMSSQSMIRCLSSRFPPVRTQFTRRQLRSK